MKPRTRIGKWAPTLHTSEYVDDINQPAHRHTKYVLLCLDEYVFFMSWEAKMGLVEFTDSLDLRVGSWWYRKHQFLNWNHAAQTFGWLSFFCSVFPYHHGAQVLTRISCLYPVHTPVCATLWMFPGS